MQCEKCKAELTDEQNFCPFCGEAVVKNIEEKSENSGMPTDLPNSIVCELCGTESPSNATFCSVCGSRLEKKPGIQVNNRHDRSNVSRIPKSKSSLAVREIVKKSIVALVSLLILIFAFLPVVTLNFKVDNAYTKVNSFDVKLTAFDCIGMCFDSMKSMDSDELKDSDYYDEILNITEDISDDLDRAELKEAYGRLAFYTIKLTLCSEQAKFRVVYLISAVLSLALILIALAVFVLSVIDLILFVLRKEISVLSKIVKNFLSLLPAFMILLFAAISYCYGGINSQNCTFALTATNVLIIVLSLCTLAYIAVDRIFFSGKPEVNVKAIVFRSLSAVFACVLLFTMFMPVMSLNVKTKFDGKTKTESASVDFDASYFGNFDLTEEQLDSYENMTEFDAINQITAAFSSLGSYSKKEFSNGDSYFKNTTILNTAFLGFGGSDYAWIMAMTPVISLLIGAIAVILLWQNTIAVVEGTSPRGVLTITVRIIAIVLAAVAVALVAVFTVVSNYNLDLVDFSTLFSRGNSATVSVNAGTIVALIFSVAAMSVPMGKINKKEIEYIEKN